MRAQRRCAPVPIGGFRLYIDQVSRLASVLRKLRAEAKRQGLKAPTMADLIRAGVDRELEHREAQRDFYEAKTEAALLGCEVRP